MERIKEFFKALDEKSKAIVIYLQKHRYAGIRELSRVIGSETDFHTLMRIKEVINPIARNILREEALFFRESRIEEGRKILFSWWLSDNLLEKDFDLFDEKKALRIVMKLNADAKIKVCCEKNAILISDGKFSKEVRLPFPVKGEIKKSYRNGVLEILMEK